VRVAGGSSDAAARTAQPACEAISILRAATATGGFAARGHAARQAARAETRQTLHLKTVSEQPPPKRDWVSGSTQIRVIDWGPLDSPRRPARGTNEATRSPRISTCKLTPFLTAAANAGSCLDLSAPRVPVPALDCRHDGFDRGRLNMDLLQARKVGGRDVVVAHQCNLIAREGSARQMFADPRQGMP
jgi:hypothetical protein